jgi:aldose 1-epimerase
MKIFTINLIFKALILAMATTAFGSEPSITSAPYGQFQERPVTLFTLVNQNNVIAKITDYGGIVVSLKVPDRDGKLDDVVLGYDDISGYQTDKAYLGAVAGRYANRICKGKFSIDGQHYQLATNNQPNHLHGGVRGFDKRLWTPTATMQNGQPQLKLEYLSVDGEEGYPGNLQVSMTYTLTQKNELKIEYQATTDKPTICNLTHHGYWNLAGPESDSVLDHQTQFYCDKFTPIDETSIPTGELQDVKGTPFDFSAPHKIGERIDADHRQIKIGKGYDHNLVINGEAGTLRPVARIYEEKSGRVMELLTTDVGVQFYSGNFLNGSIIGRNGKPFARRGAICLESQRFPDSPNQADFPSAILRPGEVYQKVTVYRFSTQ